MAESQELHIFDAFACVCRAYKETRAIGFGNYMIRNAGGYSTAAIILGGIATVFAGGFKRDLLPFMIILLAGVFLWLQRDAYRKYRGDPSLKLDLITNNNQGHRFVLFCEKLPAELKDNKLLLENLLKLLEQRQRVRKTNVITRNPIISFQLSILLMFIGAAVSKITQLPLQNLIPLGALFIGTFFITIPLNVLWRGRDYRDEELAEFVLWLWAGGAPKIETKL
jgi:hypothetical protein